MRKKHGTPNIKLLVICINMAYTVYGIWYLFRKMSSLQVYKHNSVVYFTVFPPSFLFSRSFRMTRSDPFARQQQRKKARGDSGQGGVRFTNIFPPKSDPQWHSPLVVSFFFFSFSQLF